MIYSQIAGTGSFLPERVVSNKDLEQSLETTHEWIVERTGIHRRHIAGDQETVTTMAMQAAQGALHSANIVPQDIDMVIVASCSQDKVFPSSACQIQQGLDIGPGIAFDLSAACAGFIYALSVADQFIKQGAVKHALIVGSEVMSRTVDWSDRTTCVLFGDGAGAVLLSASAEPGLLSSHLYADGRYSDLLSLSNPQMAEQNTEHSPYVFMSGNRVFRFAVKTLESLVDTTLSYNSLQQSDVDWLIPHQANIRIIEATAKKLNLPMNQVICTLEDQGNTSAASIPLALDKGIAEGKVKRGDTLLLESFGGGFAWGSALVKY